MNTEQFQKLRREVEEAKEKADRAQGSLDQLMEQLKADFGCSDLKEAKKLLEELKAKKDKAEAAFDKAMNEYERKWKND